MDTPLKMNNSNAHRLTQFYASKIEELQMLIIEETKGTEYDLSDLVKELAAVQGNINMLQTRFQDRYNEND